ncbi:MAG: class I SAM-dependent methyltransferase [Bacilli bacterium]|nr:class I SAM-dependent methyltransferase [Bacilli bacterium]
MIDELYKDYYKYSDFYDIFNKYRNYNREIRFILNMAKNKKWLLDIGCGTGTHLNALENLGYIVNGIDKSENMVALASQKVKRQIYNMDILDYKLDEKYDAIIAMHSVFNHLKSYEEFEKALSNSLDHLNKNGIMIIDLDNRRSNDDVFDIVDGNKRYLECFYSNKYNIQIRTTTFTIGLKDFIFEHEYFIYDIKKLEEIFSKYDITYTYLTNFSYQKAKRNSNRIHIVIKKV